MSEFNCPKGGKHDLDQLDYDSGDDVEYGHCKKCGHWIDVETGEDETLKVESRCLMSKNQKIVELESRIKKLEERLDLIIEVFWTAESDVDVQDNDQHHHKTFDRLSIEQMIGEASLCER